MNRREAIAMMVAVGIAPALPGVSRAANGDISWKSFPVGPAGFLRAPVLLTGERDAILIDGGFTLSDGHDVAEAIKASGRTLKAVYVSQSDPDYYFSLGPIKAAFPNAKVLAASAAIEAINGNVEKKLQVWGPKLGDNGPQTLSDIVMPEPYDGDKLELEGTEIQIVTATRLPNRRYVWVPSLKAIFGGVMVFSGTHVWTADTAAPELRAGWVGELDEMLARDPAIVVPGHAVPGAAQGQEAIRHTRDYLVAFDEELVKAKDAVGLIEAMKARYPDAGLEVALNIGAKVATGEMKW